MLSSCITGVEVSSCVSQAVHPHGSCIVTGGRRGALHQWSLAAYRGASGAAVPVVSNYSSTSGTHHLDSTRMNGTGTEERAPDGQAPTDLRNWCQPLHMEGSGHSDPIDRVVSPELYAAAQQHRCIACLEGCDPLLEVVSV